MDNLRAIHNCQHLNEYTKNIHFLRPPSPKKCMHQCFSNGLFAMKMKKRVESTYEINLHKSIYFYTLLNIDIYEWSLKQYRIVNTIQRHCILSMYSIVCIHISVFILVMGIVKRVTVHDGRYFIHTMARCHRTQRF